MNELVHVAHDGIRFAMEIAGDGPTLVLLHGLGGDRSGGLELTDPIPDRRRLAIDQRGHGETEPVGPEDGFTFDVLAADLAAILDAQQLTGPVVIAGVSMGAAVALRFALIYRSRVRALALVRPAWIHEPMTDNLTPNVEVARLLRSLPAEEARAAFQASPTYARIAAVSGHAAASLSSQFLRPGAAERAVRLDRMPRSTPYTDPAELGLIAQPTLVLGCERDPLHPIDFARTWSRLIPGASLEWVVSSADDVERHRREVRQAVGVFLARSATDPA